MSISLLKGQRIDLTKGNAGLSKIMIGLGWDPVQTKKAGFLGFGASTPNIDCDASVLMLEDDKFTNKKNLIYFGNLKSSCGSVQHTGDNITGQGDGDDEQVLVDLNKVPQNINKIVFVVNIYDCVKRKQDFGMIKNAFIRVVNSANNQEMLKFNLTDNYSGKTSLVVAEIYRHGSEWKFAAVGNGTSDAKLEDIVNGYNK
ncbi:TerD family protein [Cytobacillus sp. S13-E01]|uniref:TerD family protein n=1 Tax=Cytobacillus sp. S13-E01 TaxID=3031326 RepID=UPI0023D8532C|nr:TerD family protein [Cytobacillus sp. S13-E01]MDF0725766.1 TerD family protein [Cytobacillus sp. S13-E01]MDF0728354.1 TerD family protein [Cytobacillus sp. S13-E01]